MTTARQRIRLGWGFRFALAVLWPIMTVFTKRDWQGTEHLTASAGGVVVAPNHLSWFDPLVVAHVLWANRRPPRFLAKSSLFEVPFVGLILRSARQVPVYRQSAEAASAVRDAVAAVQRGECVVVYPEGTMTRDQELWPMRGKSGAARIALETGRPLIPMAHWGAQDVMRPYRKELRLLPRKTMHVRVGPPVRLDDLADRPLDSETLRLATDRLMAAITELLVSMRGGTPPATPIAFDGGSTR